MSTKTKKKTVTPQPEEIGKFRSIMLVHIYRYAKSGMTQEGITESLKITTKTWYAWKKKYPSINKALELAYTETDDGGGWHKFIYDRLPEDLRVLWDKIEEWDRLPNGMAKIESLLADHGKRVRQQLFLHALIHTNFSASRAMAKVCIDKDTMDYWIKNDDGFADLIDQIQWHKDNFFEESFIRLVENGSEGATIHAAKSRLRGRGYSIKSELDVNVSGSIDHNMVSLDELMPYMAKEVCAAILEAIRKQKEEQDKKKVLAALPFDRKVENRLIDQITDAVIVGEGEE